MVFADLRFAAPEAGLRGWDVVNVSAGVRYEARLEFLLPGGPAARWVATLDVPPFAEGAFAVSDLLRARSVQPRTEEPAARRDFSVDANPSLTVEPGEPFALYFEVYGVRPDADSVVGYEATVQILDAENRPLAARLLRSLGRAVGAEPAGDLRLQWERTAALRGDRLPEYLSIDPGELLPARYRIRLQLRDRAGGELAVAERTFTVR